MRRVSAALAVVVLLAALAGGCGGILLENAGEGGTVQRFQVAPGSKWSSWDHSNTKQDDMCIMLKNVSTF